MKVLIAEDDPVSSYVLAARIRKMGHEVLVTENGRQAWDAYARHRPRLVITDWMMPEMNGIELTRRIRGADSTLYTYIILLTALSGRDHFLEGMEAGADDFVPKPLEANELRLRLGVAERILNLQHELNQLEGLLPICSYCKRIRDEGNHWHSLEGFVGGKTDASFSPTLCPDCQTT
ncbi:MAG: response regulator receiver protein [Bacteroidetes bacterium]|jgi:DNA-binding response OmpR family regulator|nr:response regulator receiver protein [Bacteroidota bacterium]